MYCESYSIPTPVPKLDMIYIITLWYRGSLIQAQQNATFIIACIEGPKASVCLGQTYLKYKLTVEFLTEFNWPVASITEVLYVIPYWFSPVVAITPRSRHITLTQLTTSESDGDVFTDIYKDYK